MELYIDLCVFISVLLLLLSRFSCVRLCATPETAAHQAPPSLGFSRQEHWSGLPCPLPGHLPNPGIEPRSPALQADSLPAEPPGKPRNSRMGHLSLCQGSFWPGNRTGISCIAGRFFTSWATREAWIRIDVWQKPAQHCKAVILQLKVNKSERKSLQKEE